LLGRNGRMYIFAAIFFILFITEENPHRHYKNSLNISFVE
jgi:hypothetical protein